MKNFKHIELKRLLIFLFATKYYLYNTIITNFPSYKLRKWYLQKILKYKISKNASIHMGCFFTGANFTIGENSVVNRNCYLDCREGIVIGNNVSISPECYIITAGHDPQSSTFGGKNAKVIFQDYVWLGAKTIIVPGITMCKGSVAAAGSVVTKSVEAFSIVGGNPAIFIKNRNKNLSYQLSWFPFYNTDIT